MIRIERSHTAAHAAYSIAAIQTVAALAPRKIEGVVVVVTYRNIKLRPKIRMAGHRNSHMPGFSIAVTRIR
jgi:hypothetical protein